jgi:hypothetical protein
MPSKWDDKILQSCGLQCFGCIASVLLELVHRFVCYLWLQLLIIEISIFSIFSATTGPILPQKSMAAMQPKHCNPQLCSILSSHLDGIKNLILLKLKKYSYRHYLWEYIEVLSSLARYFSSDFCFLHITLC